MLSNLFSGLLKCGNCGAGIRFINKGAPPKGGTYLKCSASALKGECKTQAMRYELVEESLLRTIEDLDLEFLLHGERHDKKRAEKQTQLSEIESELKALQGRLNRLADAVELVSEPVPILADRIIEAQREKEGKTQRKEVVERELAELEAIDPTTQKARLEALLAQLRQGGDQSDIGRFRRSISAEIRRIIRWIKIKQITRVPHEYRIDETLCPIA
ncbi:MAG: recombinase zinc beta ribbon domain-containing protein [Novosphingobium sp.]